MQDIARKAAKLWSLTGEAELIAQRENTVFKIEEPSGETFALRLHRPGYRLDQEIASELDWMHAVQSAGMNIPQPLPSKNSRLLEHMDGLQVDVLSWVAGNPMGQSGQPLDLPDRKGLFHRLGQAMARLHAACDRWTPPSGFSRWSWNADGLLGEQPLWGRFWENEHLSAEQSAVITRAKDLAQRDLESFCSKLDYGLIHADLVSANVLLDGTEITFIDFDDGGFGYRLFDLATVLWANRHEPNIDRLEQALITGYREVRPLDTDALPLFKLLRAFTYVGWIIPRIDEPGGQERCARFIDTAVCWSKSYLKAAEERKT